MIVMIVSETSKRAHCCFVFVLQILLPLPPIPCTVTPLPPLPPDGPAFPPDGPGTSQGLSCHLRPDLLQLGKGSKGGRGGDVCL